ncbi:hypothetical protein CYMTET_30620, partial [Cymbomonas tetramitiformis]
MFEFVIGEMVLHRPKDWMPFLMDALNRYRKRTQMRPVLKPKHVKHKEFHDFYCGTRSLRGMCQAAAWLLMESRPADPISVTEELFKMPDDMGLLLKRDILKKRFAMFKDNTTAYNDAFKKGLIFEKGEESDLQKRLMFLFNIWDKNKSGHLEVEEFLKCAKDLGNSQLTMAACDLNTDGRIDLLEYFLVMDGAFKGKNQGQTEVFLYELEKNAVEWPEALIKLTEKGVISSPDDPVAEQMYTLFGIWDSDRSLVIDMAELGKILKDIGGDWEKLAAEYKGDAKLDHYAFCLFLHSLWAGKSGDKTALALELLSERIARGDTGDIGKIINPDELTSTLLELFDLWDDDKSGYIEMGELETVLKDLGGGWSEFLLVSEFDSRGDGSINRIDFVQFLMKHWEGATLKTATLALEALRKKVAGNALTDNVVKNAINPDKLYSKLGQLFDLWDADKSGGIEMKELVVVLRDIGMDPDKHTEGISNETLDREDFCEFLRVMWMGKELETAGIALEMLRKRLQGDKARRELEEKGALESSIAAAIAPDAVNEKLKELFKEWDVDGSGSIEGFELERMLRRCMKAFE